MRIKRFLAFLMCVLIVLSVSACTQHEELKLTGTEPPAASVQIGNQLFATKLGSYCWRYEGHGKCVDAVGPEFLLEGSSPISVSPGERISFVMDYEPLPNKFHLTQMAEVEYSEVSLNDLQFTAPVQEGLYYYVMSVWWMDEKRENVSNGSASYVFAIEVG